MEIYIENATINEVCEWLSGTQKVVGSVSTAGDSTVLYIEYMGNTTPVVVTLHTEESEFTSVWFNAEILPWSSLKLLAEQANRHFATRIRYEKSGEPSTFYEIADGHVREVVWD